MDTAYNYTIDWSRGTINWDVKTESNETILLATGDVSVAGEIEKTIEKYGKNFLFDPTQSFFRSADIVLGNLENPLSEKGSPIIKCGPNFCASPTMANVLADAGFTVMGIANNHARDYGDQAFLTTLKHLKNAGILPIGGGANALLATKPLIIKSGDKSIGIMALTYRQESTAKKKRPGTADLDDSECYKCLTALCDEVDIVIVYLHMGIEGMDYPAPHRMISARRFIDLGAEMVIGHHPHVPQGIEIYKGKLIAYSLGDFLFQGDKSELKSRIPYSKMGYLLKIKLTNRGTAWVKIIPYQINNFLQPIPLLNNDFAVAMNYLKRISRGIQNPELIQYMWEKAACKEGKLYLKYLLLNNHPFLFRVKSCLRPQLRYCYKSWILNLIRNPWDFPKEISKDFSRLMLK